MPETTGETPDPRSQARASVRAQIARVVFNAFAERGFDETTATEAAEAAGISRASFFRYFSSKEEAVFAAQEAMGEEIAAELESRPAEEETWTSLRRAADALVRNYERSPTEALARARLARQTPALAAHDLERRAQWQRMLGGVLAPRLRMEPGDIRAEALAGAALAALGAALRTWSERGVDDGLVELIDQAFEAVREFAGS